MQRHGAFIRINMVSSKLYFLGIAEAEYKEFHYDFCGTVSVLSK